MLHASREILRDCLSVNQRAINAAKMKYMSNLVSNNSHKPQVLFNIFNSLITPCDNSPMVPLPTLCHTFLKFFIEKLSALGLVALTSVAPYPDPTAPPLRLAVFDQFEPISLSSLSDIVKHVAYKLSLWWHSFSPFQTCFCYCGAYCIVLSLLW